MAGINSLGIGSGLDLGSLVAGLVAAERTPVESRLNRKEADFTSELSAYGLLRSALSSFQGSFASLRNSSAFNTLSATSSDSTIISATTNSGASELNAAIEVSQLARAHSLASPAFADIDTAIGEGTLTLAFGTTDYVPTTDTYNSFTVNPQQASQVITVNAANENNTLSGLKDYINANEFGVSASIVNDGSGYRLLLSSEATGAGNSMQILVADAGDGIDTDAAGLSQLAFNAAATNQQQTIAAQDALVSINGLAVTSASNTLNEALQGVTLNLHQAAPGTTVNVAVSRSSSAASANIKAFVEQYNDMITTVNDLSAFNANTQTGGPLLGDAAIRTIQSRIRGVFTSQITQLNGNVRALVDIGITTQSDGKLTLDETKLSAALNEDPDAVAALFTTQGRPTDNQIVFDGSAETTRAGSYTINITSMATRGSISGASVLPADLVSSPVVIDADNDTFTIKVDGTASSTIALTQGSYTSGDTLAAMIQAQINADETLAGAGASVVVNYDSVNNRFDVFSASYGSDSEIEFLGVDTNTAAELGFAVAAGTTGSDIAGTIGGFAATGDGQVLTGSGGDVVGLAVRILGGVAGDRGSISYSTGFIDELDDLVTSYLASDGLLGAKEEGLQSSLDDITQQRADLDLRLDRLEARLVAQFSAMDALVAQFQTTSTFLASQLAQLPGASSNNDN